MVYLFAFLLTPVLSGLVHMSLSFIMWLSFMSLRFYLMLLVFLFTSVYVYLWPGEGEGEGEDEACIPGGSGFILSSAYPDFWFTNLFTSTYLRVYLCLTHLPVNLIIFY